MSAYPQYDPTEIPDAIAAVAKALQQHGRPADPVLFAMQFGLNVGVLRSVMRQGVCHADAA